MTDRDGGELRTRGLDHAARAEADEPALDTNTRLQLGRLLSQYSQDLISQPVPDIFLALHAALMMQINETASVRSFQAPRRR